MNLACHTQGPRPEFGPFDAVLGIDLERRGLQTPTAARIIRLGPG
jgi:hypothetical protein